MEYAGKILMLVENNYPLDIRVKSEAETLQKAGYKITVISLTRKGIRRQLRREIVNGVIVYRIPSLEIFGTKTLSNSSIFNRILSYIKSIIGYFIEYFYFSFACFVLSFYISFKEKFDVIHIHNPPDTLFFVGVFHKFFGKKFVFDHHDLSPELYLSRFNRDKDIIYKILLIIEKYSIKCSDITIATNESYKNIEVNRTGINPEKVFIVRNGPDLQRVRIVPGDQTLINMNKIILTYCGVMGPQDGVDYLLRSIRILAYEFGRSDFFCILIGRGDALDGLKKLAAELKIQDFVHFTGYISEDDMFRYLSAADICLDPDPSSPLNDVSTWIKIMEYMALGKPIVTFDLKETRFSARDSAIYVEPNNEKEFAKAIALLMDDPAMRKKLGDYGKERILKELNWEIVGKNLLLAYDYLFKKNLVIQ